MDTCHELDEIFDQEYWDKVETIQQTGTATVYTRPLFEVEDEEFFDHSPKAAQWSAVAGKYIEDGDYFTDATYL